MKWNWPNLNCKSISAELHWRKLSARPVFVGVWTSSESWFKTIVQMIQMMKRYGNQKCIFSAQPSSSLNYQSPTIHMQQPQQSQHQHFYPLTLTLLLPFLSLSLSLSLSHSLFPFSFFFFLLKSDRGIEANSFYCTQLHCPSVCPIFCDFRLFMKNEKIQFLFFIFEFDFERRRRPLETLELKLVLTFLDKRLFQKKRKWQKELATIECLLQVRFLSFLLIL